MNEKVTKFYEAISADGALRDELQAVTDGIELHVEVEGELSEDELAVVAGGWVHDYGFGIEECDCPTTGNGIFTPKLEPGQCAPWGRS